VAELDPRALRPAELAWLLNPTPLGEVVRSHVIYRQRNRGGYRIGDGETVDLVEYVLWLARQRHEGGVARRTRQSYEERKAHIGRRERERSAAGRDVAPLPDAVAPERKEQASGDFRFFCEAYFPATFHLPWSPDHLKVVSRIEDAVPRGGLCGMLCELDDR
jgi:hypothetical protein